MRNKINEIARVISGRAVAVALLLAPFALFGAGVNVYTAQKDQVWNDERIVTNVTFDAEGLVTSLEDATNYVDSATNALSASLSTKIEEVAEAATNHADEAVAELDEAFSNKIVVVSSEAKNYTDSATNALASKIPVVDLGPYATKSWVEAKGYVTSAALDGVATKAWVGDQGYLTTLALTPYATMDWVLGRNYVTAAVTNGLASRAWTSHALADEARRSDARGDAKFATKDELDSLKRMYADTNGVTRLWSDDGLTMTDGTGVVWDVTWNMVTNWVSLTNGITYTMNGAMNWIGDGIVTNADGEVGVGRIWEDSAMQGMYNFGLNGFGEYDTTSPAGLLLSFDGVNMRPDAFTGVVERVASFSFRSRVVTNAVGYVTGGGGGGSVVESENNPGWAANSDFAFNSFSAESAFNDYEGNNIVDTYARKDELPSLSGQIFDFTDNRVLYTALSNIIIRLGGTVTNFPEFN